MNTTTLSFPNTVVATRETITQRQSQTIRNVCASQTQCRGLNYRGVKNKCSVQLKIAAEQARDYMCRKRSVLCAVRVFSSDNKGWEGGQQVKSLASAQYRHVKHNTQLKTDTKDAFLGGDRHNAYSKLADTRQTVGRHHARDPLVCIASSSSDARFNSPDFLQHHSFRHTHHTRQCHTAIPVRHGGAAA